MLRKIEPIASNLDAPSAIDDRPAIAWPAKRDLFGVGVTPTTYDAVTHLAIRAARQGVAAIVSCHAVHAVVVASGDPKLRAQVNSFEIVVPDGQPVRWAMNLLHDCGLVDRVYGPELMLRLCRAAAEAELPIYLCGGSEATLVALQRNLCRMFPTLRIAGAESPPFRPLSPEEDRAMVQRIRASGARLVFIGLGCPKQDVFAYEHRAALPAVQVCVGAAFDFHAGVKPMAPRWMQRHGLEWLFRLLHEPRRLWRRYLVTNTLYMLKVSGALCGRMLRRKGFASADRR